MALSAGTTIGPYAVVGLIGQGGMGEVYRARDTKLDRDVALKVLPEAFTSDPDRLARFEREAKVLASLGAAVHLHGRRRWRAAPRAVRNGRAGRERGRQPGGAGVLPELHVASRVRTGLRRARARHGGVPVARAVGPREPRAGGRGVLLLRGGCGTRLLRGSRRGPPLERLRHAHSAVRSRHLVRFGRSGFQALDHFARSCEEFLEMLGTTLFWVVFLRSLVAATPEIRVRWSR